MDKNKMIHLEVIYALPTEQKLLGVSVAEGSSVEFAIKQSGVLQHYPEIDLAQLKVGIFSRIVNLTDVVRHGDRIEIYRALVIDPVDARRLRAPIRRKKHSSMKS